MAPVTNRSASKLPPRPNVPRKKTGLAAPYHKDDIQHIARKPTGSIDPQARTAPASMGSARHPPTHTSKEFNLPVPGVPRPKPAAFVPYQIFPKQPAIDYPFDSLPDPRKTYNLPSYTHRFRYNGHRLDIGEFGVARKQVAGKIRDLLSITNPNLDTFVVDNPKRVKQTDYFDVFCKTKEAYVAIKNMELEYDHKPLNWVKSGAPMDRDQIFVRFHGMPISFDHVDLLEHLVVHFGKILRVQGMWILRQDQEFTGITFLLGQLLTQRFDQRRLPGWFNVRQCEIQLDYIGRPDFCFFCRSRNSDGHLTQNCRRKPRFR